MEEKKELKITDLNDDCLTEIFKLLKPDDLLSSFEAHKRFSRPIENAVSDMCVTLNLTDCEKINKTFIETFSDKIRKLNVVNNADAVDRSSECRELISEYFSDGNLRNLSFDNFELNASFIVKNVNMFKSLNSFKLTFAEMNECDYEKLFEAIANVKELELSNYWYVGNRRYPDTISHVCSLLHLTKLKIRLPSVRDINTVPVNTTVKELSLYLSLPVDMLLISKFPNVDTLHLSVDRKCDYESSEIPKMANLKRISIIFYNEFFTEPYFLKLADPNTLESLDLQVKEINNNVGEALYQMIDLRQLSLKLKKCINLDLLKIATNLQKLRRLSIDETGLVCHINIELICKFVQLAKNLQFLQIRISGRHKIFCDKLTEIRKIQNNKTVLNVELVSRSCQNTICIRSNEWIKVRLVKESKTVSIIEKVFTGATFG